MRAYPCRKNPVYRQCTGVPVMRIPELGDSSEPVVEIPTNEVPKASAQ